MFRDRNLDLPLRSLSGVQWEMSHGQLESREGIQAGQSSRWDSSTYVLFKELRPRENPREREWIERRGSSTEPRGTQMAKVWVTRRRQQRRLCRCGW